MKQAIYIKHRLVNILNVTKIVTILYREFDKKFVFDGESHDFWEIVYQDTGEMIATADGREIILKPGDLLFHQPGEFHTLKANGKVAPNTFVMTFECRSPAMKFFNGKCFHLKPEEKDLVMKILSETAKTFNEPFIDPVLNKPTLKKEPALGGQQMIRIYLEALLILLMRGDKTDTVFNTRAKFDNHIVERIIKLMEDNVFDDLSIDGICEKLNYSKTYLCTIFRKSTGKSIMQYYMKMKMDRAKQLLREGNLNISQISDKLSFCNPHHFSATFKRIIHMSPNEYRRSISEAGGERETVTKI